MHLGLLALTYWLNFITPCYYKSKLLGLPQDEKTNQYSQYLPPLISVACVSPAISNRSSGLRGWEGGWRVEGWGHYFNWPANRTHGDQAQSCWYSERHMGRAGGMVRVTHSLRREAVAWWKKNEDRGERNRERGMSQGIVVERATEQPWHWEIDRGKEEGKEQWGLRDSGQTERGRWRRYGREGWEDRVRERWAEGRISTKPGKARAHVISLILLAFILSPDR